MQEWLDNNDILMYSTHDEWKSVIREMFLKTLKDKIYKKMAANDSKSYLLDLNKLVDQCNADCSAFTESLNSLFVLWIGNECFCLAWYFIKYL